VAFLAPKLFRARGARWVELAAEFDDLAADLQAADDRVERRGVDADLRGGLGNDDARALLDELG
jgi:hypothetical protein